MNTVGYGDLVPQNLTEKIYCICFVYVACGLFAYTLNVVGDIIQKINKNKSHFLNNIMIINEYMNKKNITFDLRMRIRKYLEYVWQEEQYHNSEEEKLIIQKLSTSLKEELLLETNGKALRQIPFLINNFSEDTLRKLVFRLKELHYMPGDIIYEKGNYSNNSLFILEKGEIELYMDISKKDETYQVIEKTEKHKVFGEREFITGQEREISARSSSFSTVFVLDYQDFISVLLENNQEYFKFIEIKDKTSLYQDYSEIKRICCFCQEFSHTILECPLLHLKLFVPRVILKHCYHKPNDREEFARRTKKDPNARKKKNLNEFVAKTIQKEYLFTEEEGGTEFYPISSERQSSNQEKFSEDNFESSDDASLEFTKTNNTSTPINNNNANSTNNNNNTSYLNGPSTNGISLKEKETGNNLTVMNIMGCSQKMNSSKSITKENNLIPILKEAQIRSPSHKESHFNDKKTSDPRIPRYVSENTVTMNNKTDDTANISKNKLNRYASGNSLKLLSPLNKEAEKKVEIGRFFEKKMEFDNYFPHNNCENVLNIYNSRREYKVSFKNFSKKYRRNATRKVLDNELLLVNNIKQPLASPERKSFRAVLSPKKTVFFVKNEDLPIKSEIDRKAIILMLKNKRKGKEKGVVEKTLGWFVNLMKEE